MKPVEHLGPIFDKIGRLAAEDVQADPEGTFLYAELGDGWIEASIFKDLGDRIVYRDASDELTDAIMEAREAEPPETRWSILYYTISGGKFEARFKYLDEIDDEEESSFERREQALMEHFGTTDVDYSEADFDDP